MREIKNIPITEIKVFEQNAKKHDEHQVDLISKSIEQFGFNQPIVLDKNNEIVVGHGRYFAALRLNLQEVPVLILDNLNDLQIQAYRIADNKLNESEWDWGALIENLKFLDSEGFDSSVTGFDLEKFQNTEVINDPQGEWNGLPEYSAGDPLAYRKIVVSFKNEEDIQSFGNLIGLTVTDKTKDCWYPPKKNDVLKDKAYVDES